MVTLRFRDIRYAFMPPRHYAAARHTRDAIERYAMRAAPPLRCCRKMSLLYYADFSLIFR
jgi:hypothetical protein